MGTIAPDEYFESRTSVMLPRRLRTYLTINLVFAVAYAVALAILSELRTGHYLLIDIGMLLFAVAMVALVTLGPILLTEAWLWSREQGFWYNWKNRKINRKKASYPSHYELRRHQRDAYVARMRRGGAPVADGTHRTRLFQEANDPESVSRPALLLKVAYNFERSGKRGAAARCYRQVVQRFAGSREAEAARHRLASLADNSVVT